MKQKKIVLVILLISSVLAAGIGINRIWQTSFREEKRPMMAEQSEESSKEKESQEKQDRQEDIPSNQSQGGAKVNALRAEMGMDIEKDYQITEKMEGDRENYILLLQEGKEYYLRRPAARAEDNYLEYTGAFRFETPNYWIWGSTDLDNRLEIFWEDSEYYVGEDGIVPCFLWAVEFNNMGANAFSDQWEEVCAHMKEVAHIVFGDRLGSIDFNKYTLEDGNDVYHLRCIFESEEGREWMVSAAYRFGEKNIIEFIGLNDSRDSLDIGNLILYTAATYEEYGGDREPEYEESIRYKGMQIWNYEKLHNPFVLAYEEANKEAWRQIETEAMLTQEDYSVEFTEPLLADLIREALQIEDRQIMASDLLGIDSIVLQEEISADRCIINEIELEVDYGSLSSGDKLIQDLAQFKNLHQLHLAIGDVSDYSPLRALTQLEVLEIQAGKTVTDISFIEQLPNLRTLTLEKSETQIFVDSLSDELWKRTCSEMEISTFLKEYEGERGLGFDRLEIPY